MLHGAELPYKFWAEAVNMVTYIRNKCITRALGKMSPEEVWTGRKPFVNHMHVFGCKVYSLRNDYKHKFKMKGEECIFLGYALESKAYRLWSIERNRLIVSRNVRFDELSRKKKIITLEDVSDNMVHVRASKIENGDSDNIDVHNNEHEEVDGVPSRI